MWITSALVVFGEGKDTQEVEIKISRVHSHFIERVGNIFTILLSLKPFLRSSLRSSLQPFLSPSLPRALPGRDDRHRRRKASWTYAGRGKDACAHGCGTCPVIITRGRKGGRERRKEKRGGFRSELMDLGGETV